MFIHWLHPHIVKSKFVFQREATVWKRNLANPLSVLMSKCCFLFSKKTPVCIQPHQSTEALEWYSSDSDRSISLALLNIQYWTDWKMDVTINKHPRQAHQVLDEFSIFVCHEPLHVINLITDLLHAKYLMNSTYISCHFKTVTVHALLFTPLIWQKDVSCLSNVGYGIEMIE